jgi:hypothetical protein
VKIAAWRAGNKELRISFKDATTCIELGEILDVVRGRLGGRILQQVEGPDAIVSLIEVEGVRAWLVCDDELGIFLKGDPELSEESLQALAERIAVML